MDPRPLPAGVTRAEAERFELSCPVKGNSISSRARYDHFDTPPCHFCILPNPAAFVKSYPPLRASFVFSIDRAMRHTTNTTKLKPHHKKKYIRLICPKN